LDEGDESDDQSIFWKPEVAHNYRSLVYRSAVYCAISTEIAQYLQRLRNNIDHGHPQSRDALRVTEKKFLLILDKGSQSYLSWFIVSLPVGTLTISSSHSFDIFVNSEYKIH